MTYFIQMAVGLFEEEGGSLEVEIRAPPEENGGHARIIRKYYIPGSLTDGVVMLHPGEYLVVTKVGR